MVYNNYDGDVMELYNQKDVVELLNIFDSINALYDGKSANLWMDI
jgi:hypothetical protein